MSHQSSQSPFLCDSTTHISASALLNANCLQYHRLEHECNKHAVLLKKSAQPVRKNGSAYKTCTVKFGNLWSVIATCTESESLTASTMKWVIWKFSEMSGLVLAKVMVIWAACSPSVNLTRSMTHFVQFYLQKSSNFSIFSFQRSPLWARNLSASSIWLIGSKPIRWPDKFQRYNPLITVKLTIKWDLPGRWSLLIILTNDDSRRGWPCECACWRTQWNQLQFRGP